MLSRIEEFLLLAVNALGDNASAAAVRLHLETTMGKRLSVGSIYVPLERMVRQKLLAARDGDPTPKRGGRRKRMYRVTGPGFDALAETRRVQEEMWQKSPAALADEATR